MRLSREIMTKSATGQHSVRLLRSLNFVDNKSRYKHSEYEWNSGTASYAQFVDKCTGYTRLHNCWMLTTVFLLTFDNSLFDWLYFSSVMFLEVKTTVLFLCCDDSLHNLYCTIQSLGQLRHIAHYDVNMHQHYPNVSISKDMLQSSKIRFKSSTGMLHCICCCTNCIPLFIFDCMHWLLHR